MAGSGASKGGLARMGGIPWSSSTSWLGRPDASFPGNRIPKGLTSMKYVDINLSSMSRAQAVSFATTLRVRDCCLCLHVQRAARALARRFDEALRPLGLTNGQFSLLMSLNRPEAPGMASVAELLAMDRTTLTAALKPLERRGLVRVVVDPRDRRGRKLLLTAQGKRLLAEAAPVWERTHAETEAGLGESEADRLRRDLRALG
jgi:DNA-binding MarR family transcriptional regulator